DPAAMISAAIADGEDWRGASGTERGTVLRRAALGLVAARDRLIEVLAAESGRPIHELDREVSGAVDAARFAGGLAERLDTVRGATFAPEALTAVVTDAHSPLTGLAEGALSALAAGSAVILLPDPGVARTAAVFVEELEAATLPPGLIRLAVAEPDPLREAAAPPSLGAGPGAELAEAPADEPGAVPAEERADAADEGGDAEAAAPLAAPETLAERFAADPRVDRIIARGARARARALVRRRPDLRVQATLASVGSLVVTPNADLSDAVRDVVASAFSNAGGDPDGIQLVILVGSVARTKRFQRMLADAVRALRTGSSVSSHDAGPEAASSAGPGATPAPESAVDPLFAQLGPLAGPARGDALRALTELDSGESWLIEPEARDAAGRLWSAGVRLGVKRDAWLATTPVAAPVLGVVTAHTLGEALAIQAGPGSGAVAGLHSLDADEIAVWVDQAPAAALSVNRPTVNTRLGRQGVGGWRDAGMGMHPLGGAPNRLVTLGSWTLREGTQSSTLHLRGLDEDVVGLIETAQASLSYADFDLVRRAALSDQLSWAERYGAVRDSMGLGIERNLLRYWPVATQLRLAEGGSLAELLRVLAAALLVRAPVSVSTGQVLPAEVQSFLQARFVSVSLERDADWLERIAASGIEEERIRLIGGDRVRAAEWLGGLDRTGLWAEPVTMAGPVELLSLLREQSLSITAHRRGVATSLTDALF
ncbi:aldehyde dehydrogenase family protein, partial [Leucobacter sp. M11]|uniref:aldehyde dehydrogenase family protein n=1 Tax=Leucobacter sp. M11 TaxID=2993565 RepID=UPI002D8082C7